ncbi:MAG TPA: PH domain-containing protein [Moheibacter sp.]|nr:PH domain-containing protein [Moheibacter sp.]
MKFKSTISKSSVIGLGLFVVFFIGLTVYFWLKNPNNILVNVIISICSLGLAGFFLFLFDTFYEINSDSLKLKSGISKEIISIHSIKEIDIIDSIWNFKILFKLSFLSSSNRMLALGNRGIIIKYKNFEEVYISPESQENFINELLKINPEIKVNRSEIP